MVKTKKLRVTRKVKKQSHKILSIPELRKAFSHIDNLSQKLQSLPKDEQISTFKKEWESIFGREISTKAVESYLAVKHGLLKGRKGKTRKQKGGSYGAPLDYQTRPGIDGVHGQFPAYIDRGLIPYPEPGIQQECGTKDFTPHPLPSIGSNQAGGATFSEFTSALTFKPFESTVPSSFYQDMRSAYLGKELPPSPAVEDHTWKYK